MHALERYQQIRRVLINVLLMNWAVAATKLSYGYLIRSASMTADGFHSFSDGASNIIGLAGIWVASRPTDENHPYGHKKFETLTSVGISVLLFLVCFNVVREGILRFLYPVVPKINIRSFVLMGLTLTINIAVMRYERRKGRELRSDVLISDSLHTRADIFTSLSVLLAFVGIQSGFPILDPIASIFIAVFIAYAAVAILRESSRILSDGVAIPTTRIEQIVLSVPGVKECHQIRSRGRADDIHIDLHVLVDPEMHVDQAHHVSYAIEGAIKKKLRGVTDVVVHMEPMEKEK